MPIYSKKPRSIAQYTMMRGVTDYSNAAQFNMYESGYQYLIVISTPVFMDKLAEQDTEIKTLVNAFKYILEYEFKGLDGIDDITVDPIEFTDGINTMNIAGKVTQQSATEITMSFTEKSGSIITKYLDKYLRGVKDPRTQAKTYHGLIASGKLAPGLENEVFNMMYIVTDNTLLNLEKAYLLVNGWFNKVPTSIYNGQKGEIDKKEIDVTMQCFVIDGEEVDKRALKMLAYINEKDAVKNTITVSESSAYAVQEAGKINTQTENVVQLDSGKYNYNGFNEADNFLKKGEQ